MKKNIFICITITLLFCLWFILGPKKHEEPGLKQNQNSTQGGKEFSVVAINSTEEPVAQAVHVNGKTKPNKISLIAAETEGRLEQWAVEKGNFVQQGEPIAQLDSETLSIQQAQAQARYKDKQIAYESAKNLLDKQLTSEAAFQSTLAAMIEAKTAKDLLEKRLSDTKITAPFSGYIAEKHKEVGEYAKIGDPIALLVDNNTLLAEAVVTETDILGIKLGQEVEVTFPEGMNRVQKGVITYIAPHADERTRTFNIEARLDNTTDPLPAGQTVRMQIPKETHMAHAVPNSALVLDIDGNLGVKTLSEDNLVEFHPVNLIQMDSKKAWCTGLPPKIRLITVGQDFVKTASRAVSHE